MAEEFPFKKRAEYGQPEQRLGQGGYGEVHRFREKDQTVAIKRMTESMLSASVLNEITTMIAIPKDPTIMPLLDIIPLCNPPEEDLCLVLPNGVSSLAKQPGTQDPSTIFQMCYSVSLLHSLGWLHRDIKEANYIRMPDGSVKLSDWGLADNYYYQTGKSDSRKTYTPAYHSPEYYLASIMLAHTIFPKEGLPRYGLEQDMWALGCALFGVVTGETMYPYQESIPTQMVALTDLLVPDPEKLQDIKFKPVQKVPLSDRWQAQLERIPNINPLLVGLIMSLLEINPEFRLKSSEILYHPYFDDWQAINYPVHLPDILVLRYYHYPVSPTVNHLYREEWIEELLLIEEPHTRAHHLTVELLDYLIDEYKLRELNIQDLYDLCAIYNAYSVTKPELPTDEAITLLNAIGWNFHRTLPYDFLFRLHHRGGIPHRLPSYDMLLFTLKNASARQLTSEELAEAVYFLSSTLDPQTRSEQFVWNLWLTTSHPPPEFTEVLRLRTPEEIQETTKEAT